MAGMIGVDISVSPSTRKPYKPKPSSPLDFWQGGQPKPYGVYLAQLLGLPSESVAAPPGAHFEGFGF